MESGEVSPEDASGPQTCRLMSEGGGGCATEGWGRKVISS